LTHETDELDTAAWSEGESDVVIQLVSLQLSRAEVVALMQSAIGVEQISVEGEESGTAAPEPSDDAASTATQVEQRLRAAGYPVEVDGTAPPMVGNFGVSFEGGPTNGGYAITAYVYESAQDASANLEELDAQIESGSMSPEEEEALLSKLGCILRLRGWRRGGSRSARQVHQGRRGRLGANSDRLVCLGEADCGALSSLGQAKSRQVGKSPYCYLFGPIPVGSDATDTRRAQRERRATERERDGR
jgi:hypothetical protein